MENPDLILRDNNDPDPEPAIKWGWLRALLQFVVWLILVIVVETMVAVVIILIQGQDPLQIMSDPAGIGKKIGVTGMTVLSLLELICTLLTVLLFRKFIDKKSILSLGFKFKEYRNDLFAGMGWGFVIILVGFMVLWISGAVNITGIRFNPSGISTYFILFIIVALNEEILTRGYILSNLMDSMNRYAALILTAILFSAMHIMNDHSSVFSTFNIFISGILLGVYFIYRRNLWFSIGMHLTWNFFQGPVFGFGVSGHATESIIITDITGPELINGGKFGLESSIVMTITMFILITVLHYKYRKA